MKYKLIYTGLILFVYILGRCIPLYGVDVPAYSHGAVNAEELLLQSIGGDVYRYSVFAIGMSPFMISNILVQIVMACRDSVSKARISPGKVSRISVGLTLVIAILQAFMRVSQLKFKVAGTIPFFMKTTVIAEMVTGVMVILWLSERNAKYGIGGRTTLILVNILDGIISTVSGHDLQSLIVPLAVSVVVMFVILIMENAEKRIPVQRISIHNIYADKNYMAVKLNPVGVMPVMFSTAMFMLPQMLVSLLGYFFPNHSGIKWWQENLSLLKGPGIAIYIMCLCLLTVVFSMVLISPKDITEQFLKSGDSLVNIHAGRDTKRYLRGVMWRISLFSAVVMSVCVGVPLMLQTKGNIDSTLMMLPSSIMMLTGLWCNIYREAGAVRNYDSYQPIF
ncbi:accessory Sec system protein translocase subunit SecY2 [Lachnospiraceae bacterium 54-11]